MKISVDNQVPAFQNTNISNFTIINAIVPTWDNGAIQGGSSGAAYFDQNQRVIAQHSGSRRSCDDRISFGGTIAGAFINGFNNVLTDDPSVMTTNVMNIPSFGLPNDICANTPINYLNFPSNMTLIGGSIVGVNMTGFFAGLEPQSGYHGQGHLEFHLKPNGITCNDPLIIRKDFGVGLPLTPQVTFMPEVECYGWLAVDNPQPTHTYNWVITRGQSTYYVSGPIVYLSNWGPNYSDVGYSVTASNSCGAMTASANVILTNCDGPLFTGPNSSSLAITARNKTYNWTMQLSPNPVSNDLNIALSAYDERLMHTMGEMHVVNMMGQTVYKAKQVLDNNMRLNTQNLNNGFYILEIKGKGFSTRQRFNVSR